MTLLSLLLLGILTLWIEQRWAWSLCQIGVFALTGWRLLQKRDWKVTPAALVLGAAALWPLLQLALGTTMSRRPTEDAASTWLSFLLFFLLGQELRRDATVIGGTVLAGVSLLTKFTGDGRIFWLFPSGYSSGVLGPFVNRNQFAAWVELVLPIALYLAASSRRHRTLYAIAASILFTSVIASGSRAGAVLVTAEAIAALVLFRGKLALRFSAIAIPAIAIAGWQELGGRLATMGPEPLRVDAVRASLDMVRDHPFLGTGLGTWSRIYPRYAGLDTGLVMNQAHNDWAQWAAEGGIPFFLCLIVFAGLLWKPAIRSIYGLGVLAFLLHALVDYPMQQRPALAAWFFAIAGMTTHDVLRRTCSGPNRDGGRNPARVQASRESDAPRPVSRGGDPASGRNADEAAERHAGSPGG